MTGQDEPGEGQGCGISLSVGDLRHGWCPECKAQTLATGSILAISPSGVRPVGGYRVCERCCWTPPAGTGAETARRGARHGRGVGDDRRNAPIGHSRSAHRVLGWCSHCRGRTVSEELIAWRLKEYEEDGLWDTTGG